MRKGILFVFLSVMSLSLYSHAQFACAYTLSGTVRVTQPGNSCPLLVTAGEDVFVQGGLFTFAFPGPYILKGRITGDLGDIQNDIPAVTQIAACTSTQVNQVDYQLSFHTHYAPGSHTLTTTFYWCDALNQEHFWKRAKLVITAVPTTKPPCTPLLIDPVKSNLLQGPAVTIDTASIVKATDVYDVGVSADGISQAVIAIQASNLGDTVQVNLLNDSSNPSSSSDEDGGLTQLGGAINSIQNSIGIVADTTTDLGPTAFALYRAPTNFHRGTQDDALVERKVTFQAFCPASDGSIPDKPTTTPVVIQRPPWRWYTACGGVERIGTTFLAPCPLSETSGKT